MSKKRRKAKSVEHLASRRTPGLDGTYDGSCVACLRPTDTALGFRGEPGWHAAGLTKLGLPIKEAITTVHRFLEEVSGGPDPDGRYSAVYRVCGDCAARTPGFPKPVLALAGEPVPTIEQDPA